MQESTMTWKEIYEDDVQYMHDVIDSLVEKMKGHLSYQEKWEYLKPIRDMLREAHTDITFSNGIPTFGEVEYSLQKDWRRTTPEEDKVLQETFKKQVKSKPSRPNRK